MAVSQPFFDAVYTGFLGSFEQLDIVSEIFDRLKKPENLLIVDPVMADNGSLYTIFPKNFPDGMKKLCAKADVIVPNITEAALLLDEPFMEGPYTQSYIENLLYRLAALGPKKVILTGVYFENAHLGAASYDVHTRKVNYAFSKRIDGYYHGTGDVFASVIVACLLNGAALERAVRVAVDFTIKSIVRTKEAGTDIRFGVNFEAGLHDLVKDINAL